METVISEGKNSCYAFEILECSDYERSFKKSFRYKIYGNGCAQYDDGIIESQEEFETEQEARFAAIGHITKLEEGPDDY